MTRNRPLLALTGLALPWFAPTLNFIVALTANRAELAEEAA